jgi:hypothetical protein
MARLELGHALGWRKVAMLKMKKWSDFALGLVVSMCALQPSIAATSKATLLFESDFENNSLDGWNVSGNSPAVQRAIKRNGNFAMKSVLNRKTSPVPYRTEVSTGGQEDVQYGQEYWYGFSIYLPAPFNASTAYEIVAQWHGVNDPGEASLNPALALRTENNMWSLSNLSDDRQITVPDGQSLHGTQYASKQTYELGKYATNVWTDWVFRIKWAYNSSQNGSLTVWKNGVKVLDAAGPNCFNDAKGPYFKMGLYKGWQDRVLPADTVSERVVYHDELRIAGPGASFADVSPGSKTVRPTPPSGIAVQ